MDERRSYQRKTLRCKVLLRVDERILSTHSIDISSGGMSVICDINLPPRKNGEVYFYMPITAFESEPFRAEVTLTNSAYSHSDGGFRIGLNFRKMSQRALTTLTSFLDRRS